MDYQKLADLLFPDVTETPADIEARFPARSLPEGAKVTRIAPSPTGYVHFGGMYQVVINERLAHLSDGRVYLRIEDTDSKREVSDAAQKVISTFAHYGIHFDEGAVIGADGEIASSGDYGPYQQSKRASIYHVFAKALVQAGHAYPVFSTEAELQAALSTDKKTENKEKDWEAEAAKQKAEMLQKRQFTLDEVAQSLARGEVFVLRLLADGDPERKTPFVDLIKGKLEIPENDEDFVLLKSDGIPTYHFAHAVDDHLMGTTHVVRGEEWLPSLAKHIMLFRFLGFRMPKYLHTAQIMRLDENGNKKKLSKRDMGANMADYDAAGYPPVAVIEYIMTLLNSNYEEWHAANPDKPYTDFPFSVKKMSASGCLFDFQKLNDVAKNVMAHRTADDVYGGLCDWAKIYAPDYYEKITADAAYATRILSIGRGGKKPRKDYGTYAEAMAYTALFYDDTFAVTDAIDAKFSDADIDFTMREFARIYDANDDQNTWFEKLKQIAAARGYATDMKAYRQSPDAYPGSIGDISMFLRVAVTGKLASPDMYEVMQILGAERVLNRVENFKIMR